MRITEIWTYPERGCQYLHPIACYDRVLQCPGKMQKPSEHCGYVSQQSSSSLSSLFGKKDAVAEAEDSIRTSSSQLDTSGSEEESDAAYNHRVRLVRTCSLRRTIQKTFLEPICDECLLLELGLAPEIGSSRRRHDSKEQKKGDLGGAEWLLESSVEITVEPPAEEDDILRVQSKPSILCSSSEDEGEDETPRRGRGRRRAMEISRASLAIDEGYPPRRRASFQRLKQTGQHLRKARKRHDLRPSSNTSSRFSKSSSATPSSWIEHLKSDLEERVRKKKSDAGQATESAHPADSSSDAPSCPTGDDRIFSLPSIPATASSTFSTASINPEDSIMLALDQIISSSDFDSSHLNSTQPSGSRPEALHSDRENSARKSNSSSRSAKSLNTPILTVSPSSSPVAGSAENVDGISLHPLSWPLLPSTCVNKEIQEDCRPEDHNDRYEDRRHERGDGQQQGKA